MEKSVILKRGKEESLQRFHPWIFSGAIQRIDGKPEEGDVVTSKNSYCAKAVSVTQKHTPALSQTETNYSYLSFRRKLQRE